MKRDPFLAAETKGRKAARDGLSRESCPYEDRRKPSGKLSWSRAWRNAWLIAFDPERLEMNFENKVKPRPVSKRRKITATRIGAEGKQGSRGSTFKPAHIILPARFANTGAAAGSKKTCGDILQRNPCKKG